MAQAPVLLKVNPFLRRQEQAAMFTSFSRLDGREALPKMLFNDQISGIGSAKCAFKTTLANWPLFGSEMKPASLMTSSFRRTHHVLLAVLGQKSEASEPAGEEGELKDQALHVKDDVGPNIPVLSVPEVIEKMQENMKRRPGKQSYRAMYSSIFGGITIDPALMVIPIDDHMVHRGHGVFDTAAIIDGYLYELDPHLDRFLRSASMAKITPPFDLSHIRNILVRTVAASQCKEGALRYWLTAGPGDFLLSSSGCPVSAFYAVVLEYKRSLHIQGVKVVTSSIPMKPPQFAIMKSVNYLPNVLAQMEAEEKGASAAIWFDNEGFVAEGPNMNVAFVNTKKELLMPSFEKVLTGCTAKRLLDLAPRLIEQGLLNGIQVRNITAEEGKASEEMMLVGSGVHVLPVVMWDDQPIGTGKEGPVTYALLNLLLEDMKCGPDWVRIRVPYGEGNTHSDN